MFLLAAACMAAGCMSLVLFATADVQHYNDPDWRAKKKAKQILANEEAVKIAKCKSKDRRLSAGIAGI